MGRCIDCINHKGNRNCDLSYKKITFENLYKDSYCPAFRPKENKMEMELKIEKERVLKAAEKCSQAKEILEELFPEVFENEDWLEVAIGTYFTMYENEICQLVRYGGNDTNITLINCKTGNRYFDGTKFIEKVKGKTYISKDFLKSRRMKRVAVRLVIE